MYSYYTDKQKEDNMRRNLASLSLAATVIALTSCAYDQTNCYSDRGYVVTTTRYVPVKTYVPATNYVTVRAPTTSCCTTNYCCPSCNRCGSAYYGSGYNYDTGYGYDNAGWYW